MIFPPMLVIVVLISWQHVISETFEPSPFMHGGSKGFDDDATSVKQQREQNDLDQSVPSAIIEKENSNRENNVAKIKVVVSWLYT